MITLGADKELAIFCDSAATPAPVKAPAYQKTYYGNYKSHAASDNTHSLSAEVMKHLSGISKEGAEEEARKAALLFEKQGHLASDRSFNEAYYQDGAADKGSEKSWVFDSNRKWLPANGGCFYIDMGHVEMALPECSTAERYLATHDDMLRMATAAMDAANASREQPIKMGVFNSDMHGSSWGGHDNYNISRNTWGRICGRSLIGTNMLAAFQASAVLLCGQGKVGVENNKSATTDGFQMSTRADFLKCLTSIQTTYDRPLINLRDEPHGNAARLHVIWFDQTVAPVATYLRVGAMSLFLAMMEEGYITDTSVMIEYPLYAAINMQRDTTLQMKFETMSGKRTIVDVQDAFCRMAENFVAEGRHIGHVEDASAKNIVALWRRVVDDFRKPDWLELNSRRIDWVMKLKLLKTFTERSGTEWDPAALDAIGTGATISAESRNWALKMRAMDMQFHALGETSIFQKLRRLGQVEEVLTQEQHDSMVGPDPNTRAFTRAHLIRAAMEQKKHATVDWDRFSCDGFSIKTLDPGQSVTNVEGVIASAGEIADAIVMLGGEENAPYRYVPPQKVPYRYTPPYKKYKPSTIDDHNHDLEEKYD